MSTSTNFPNKRKLYEREKDGEIIYYRPAMRGFRKQEMFAVLSIAGSNKDCPGVVICSIHSSLRDAEEYTGQEMGYHSEGFKTLHIMDSKTMILYKKKNKKEGSENQEEEQEESNKNKEQKEKEVEGLSFYNEENIEEPVYSLYKISFEDAKLLGAVEDDDENRDEDLRRLAIFKINTNENLVDLTKSIYIN